MNNILEITSTSNQHIKDLAKLKEKKYRTLYNEFIVEGYHLVNEAYKKRLVVEVLSLKKDELLQYDNCKLVLTGAEVIKKLSDTENPQSIIAICKIKRYECDYNKTNCILILDDVRDPGNVGTLIRTSLGFNIDLVLLSNNSVDIYNSKVIRATQGALFNINICYGDLKEEILKIKKANIKVFGTSLDSAVSLSKEEKPNRYAIVLGNEANGMSEEVKSLCDKNLFIDINPKLESLNVSIAGAIAMYEFSKR